MTPAQIRAAHADAKLLEKLGFSQPEAEAIRSAVSAVWDECAYDVLQAVAEEKGKKAEQVTVSRAVAMEIALDAGRPEENLKSDMRRAAKAGVSSVITEDLLKRWDELSYEDRIAFVKPRFPYSRYGL